MNYWIINSKIRIITNIIFEVFLFLVIFVVIPFNNQLLFSLKNTLIIIFVWEFLFYISGKYHDLVQIKRRKLKKVVAKNFLVFISTCTLIYFYLSISNQFKTNQNFDLELIIIYFFSILINQIMINSYINKKDNSKDLWLIYKDNVFKQFIEDKLLDHELKFSSKLIFIDNLDQLNFLEEKQKELIKGIITTDKYFLQAKEISILLKSRKKSLKIYSSIEWSECYLYRIPSIFLNKKHFLEKENLPHYSFFNFWIKNIAERILSFVLLLCAFPILVIFCILIFLEDKGSFLYSQYRTGINGKRIKIFKLRTMKINAEKDGIRWSSKNDRRVTKIGSFLRKTRIDEIPQLFSVLIGEMSLIGPRPERPEIEFLLNKEIANYKIKYLIKPGLTGWAQVNFSYGASVTDSIHKISYDIFYIFNYSLFLDFLIFLKTIKTVFKMEGSDANSK